MRYIYTLLIMILILGCKEEPQKGEVLYVDVNNQSVYFKTVPINNIVDLTSLEGDRFKIKTGAEIDFFVYTDKDPETMTIKDVNDLTFTEGEAPYFRYYVEDGVAIPYSLYDYILLTLYYNLEEALIFFESIGLNLEGGARGDSWETMSVYFNLNIFMPNEYGEKENMKDNAFYYSPLKALGFCKQEELKHLALVSNPMVITHEFAHAIFDFLAVGRLKSTDLYSESELYYSCDSAFYTSAFNEGFSDYWGSRRTNSPDMFYLSISEEELGVEFNNFNARTLDNNITLDEEMLVSFYDTDCYEAQTEKSYYWGGTIFASSLWEIVNNSNIEIENFDKYVLESYSCIYQQISTISKITMATPINCIVKNLKTKTEVSENDIDLICSIFKRRFSIIEEEINECN